MEGESNDAVASATAMAEPAASGSVERLMISHIEMVNFKSYFGKKIVGPFHKVAQAAWVAVCGTRASCCLPAARSVPICVPTLAAGLRCVAFGGGMFVVSA